MADIFLSYNREDSAVARRFAEGLEREGFSVWWDVTLRSGEAYDEVTEAALHESGAVVVLWSPRSVVSRWVRAEATLADRAAKLIPAMIEPCQRPIMFELTQTAELGHWKGDAGDAAWRGFVGDLARHLGGERTPVAVAPAAPAALAEPLLAVLPFDNLSSDPDMQFFSDGVSEEILQQLASRARLKTIGRTSSFQLRGERKAEAAALLKCSHVLDGSVRRAGSQVRIAAQLIETASHTTLWSERFDRTLEDIFAVQDEISAHIAAALDSTFSGSAPKPVDPQAYDWFLRARPESFRPDEARSKIKLLEAATARDPGFAEAWGRLAYLRTLALFYDPYRERSAARALAAAEADRALAADPANGEALSARFLLAPPFGGFVEADGWIERLRAAPGFESSKFFVSFFLVCVGRVKEAAAYNEELFASDPLNTILGHRAAVGRMSLGHYDEAIVLFEQLLASSPDHQFLFWTMVRACALQGDWHRLDKLLTPAMQARHPVAGFEETARLVELLRASQESDQAEAVRATWLMPGARAESSQLTYAAHLGLTDEALDLALTAPCGPDGSDSDVMGPDAYRTALPFWHGLPALRSDQRFIAYCARLGLVEYWLTSGKWPDCADETPYDFRAECAKYRGFAADRFFGWA